MQPKKIEANPSNEAISGVLTKVPKKWPKSGKNQQARNNPTITEAREIVSRANPLRKLLTIEAAKISKTIQSKNVNSNGDMSLVAPVRNKVA